MIDRNRSKTVQTRGASAKRRFCAASVAGSSLRTVACASEQHIVGSQESAYGKYRLIVNYFTSRDS
jgi:hypothetical protein